MHRTLQIVPVTDENRAEVLALAVSPDQRHHIETTGESLEEASRDARWRPVALCVEGTAVGFAMYGGFREHTKEGAQWQIWLDRLLIDARYQGKGYGEEALRLLIARLEAEYETDFIYLSVYGDNDRAIALYEKAGFAFTGGLDTKGEKVMSRCRTV